MPVVTSPGRRVRRDYSRDRMISPERVHVAAQNEVLSEAVEEAAAKAEAADTGMDVVYTPPVCFKYIDRYLLLIFVFFLWNAVWNDIVNLNVAPGVPITEDMLKDFVYPPPFWVKMWWGFIECCDPLLGGNEAYFWTTCLFSPVVSLPFLLCAIYCMLKRKAWIQPYAIAWAAGIFQTCVPVIIVYYLDNGDTKPKHPYLTFLAYSQYIIGCPVLIARMWHMPFARTLAQHNFPPSTNMPVPLAKRPLLDTVLFVLNLVLLVAAPLFHYINWTVPEGTYITPEVLDDIMLPRPAKDIWYWYATNFAPYKLQSERWLQIFSGYELFLGIPFYLVATHCIAQQKQWFRPVALVWAGWTFFTTIQLLITNISDSDGMPVPILGVPLIPVYLYPVLLFLRFKDEGFPVPDDLKEAAAAPKPKKSVTRNVMEHRYQPGDELEPHDPAARVLYPPSQEMKILFELMPCIFNPEETNWFNSALQHIFVVPITNLANFSFYYQYYLYHVFHQTIVGKLSHYFCMPFVNFFLMAALAQWSVYGESNDDNVYKVVKWNGAWFFCLMYVAWWTIWGGLCNVMMMAVAMYPYLFILGTTSTLYFNLLGNHDEETRKWYNPTGHVGTNPWMWWWIFCTIQALGHTFEPLTPRVNGTAHWMTFRQYIIKMESVGELADAIGNLAAQALVFGVIDEALASLRYLPIQMLKILFLCGYKTDEEKKLNDLIELSLLFGQPALDYIGWGGGQYYRDANQYDANNEQKMEKQTAELKKHAPDHVKELEFDELQQRLDDAHDKFEELFPQDPREFEEKFKDTPHLRDLYYVVREDLWKVANDRREHQRRLLAGETAHRNVHAKMHSGQTLPYSLAEQRRAREQKKRQENEQEGDEEEE